MTDKAYQYIDWAAIEGLVYSEENHPKAVLEPKSVKEGTLYQCFMPGVEKVSMKDLKTGKTHTMVMEDEIGYFAKVLPGKKPHPHSFIADGVEIGDPYAFPQVIQNEEAALFASGISKKAYKMLGSHSMEISGQKGMFFALWAPNAMRVSVVGDFNRWDGRMFPMEYNEDTGIFELFIPGLPDDLVYAYEIKLSTGNTFLRPDPYGLRFDRREDHMVTVCTDLSYRWHDRAYLTKRSERQDTGTDPFAVFFCSLRSFAEKTGKTEYRELAEEIIPYVKEMGFTHIRLEPIMEYPEDSSNGYQTSGYYAPTYRYGTPLGLKHFVDLAHENEIGVILTWTPGQFAANDGYLGNFDGTCLYEHVDPRQGIHPLWGSRLYNYGRGEVSSFLLSNARFWMREYHMDGFYLDGCETILKADYMRGDQWVANMYGGSDHLEGMDFLKKLSATFKNEFPEGILMLSETIDIPELTTSLDQGGYGMDYKMNLHFAREFREFLSLDEAGRKGSFDELTNAMLHHYMDRFVMSLSGGEGGFSLSDFMAGMKGETEEKESLLRAAYAFTFLHPGKKELNYYETLQDRYLKDLIGLYTDQKALSVHDYEEAGFEWINTMDQERGVLSFLRKADRPDETLLVVCNFSDEEFPEYQVGVPYKGKYKEILNTDAKIYGGSGVVNARMRTTKKEVCDERDHTLKLRLAGRSVSVFSYRGTPS